MAIFSFLFIYTWWATSFYDVCLSHQSFFLFWYLFSFLFEIRQWCRLGLVFIVLFILNKLEKYEYLQSYWRAEVTIVSHILQSWICIAALLVGGELLLVFQRGLYQKCISWTEADQTVCHIFGARNSFLDYIIDDMDNNIPNSTFWMGRGGWLYELYNSLGQAISRNSRCFLQLSHI